MNRDSLILVGGGGHCKSVIEVVEATGQFSIAGIVDIKENIGTEVSGYPVIASDEDIDSLTAQYRFFLVTVGQVKSSTLRNRLFQLIKNAGGILPTVVAPTAYVSKRATIGEGTVIHHHAFVNAGAKIGVNCIINTSALVEHDTRIGDHCHISTAAVINGNSTVGNYCFIGSKAVLSQGIEVGDNCLVGAGAVVLTNTEAGSLYAGNPAVLKKRLS